MTACERSLRRGSGVRSCNQTFAGMQDLTPQTFRHTLLPLTAFLLTADAVIRAVDFLRSPDEKELDIYIQMYI